MNPNKLIKLIVERVIKIQELSGREVPDDVNEKTIPIGGLAGFDSLNGLELTMMLPDEIKWGGKNLCVSDEGRRALTIREIVIRLLQADNHSD